MIVNSEINQNTETHYTSNNSNTLVIEVDKSEKKDFSKFPKNKVFKQVPIDESDQFDSLESKNFCSKLKNIFNYLDKLDKKISKPLQNYTPNYLTECIFLIFAKLFNNTPVTVYLFIILIYSFFKKNFNLFLIIFFHVINGVILTGILKKIIGRNRPTLTVNKYFNFVRDKEKTKSMPSGDSLQAGIFATMIILYLNNDLKYFSLLFIPASMTGRVFYCCHYWFDCIIGAILGIIISICNYYILIVIKSYMR